MDYRIDGRELTNGEIVSAIFEDRDIDSDRFLHQSSGDLIPYEKMHNIQKAFNIIDKGIEDDKCFLIWADTDTDGVCSGVIMYRYLEHFTDKVFTTINEGKEHGVASYSQKNVKEDIIIIVDSLNDFELYEKILQDGKQIVILDHHDIPKDDLPKYDLKNIALVSSVNDYPNPELSGAGVVWKFCSYMDEQYLTDYAIEYADLAACGIIADMMNITIPENRYICDLGINSPKNPAIQAINGGYQYNSQAVSFGIAPLINAANRLRKNKVALLAFLSNDETTVKELIKELKELKIQQDTITTNVMTLLEPQITAQKDNKVIVCVSDTGADMSGLIANKIVGAYQRPVVILRENGDCFTGSGRGYGVENFNNIASQTGFAECAGHPNAFGITVKQEYIEKFTKAVNEALSDIDFKIINEGDVLVTPEQITADLIDKFKYINRISGEGFKPLTVCLNNLTDYTVGNMSKGKHLKITVGDFVIIKWNYMGDFTEFDGRPLSVIGTLDCGYFGKTFYKQVIVQDILVGEQT